MDGWVNTSRPELLVFIKVQQTEQTTLLAQRGVGGGREVRWVWRKEEKDDW